MLYVYAFLIGFTFGIQFNDPWNGIVETGRIEDRRGESETFEWAWMYYVDSAGDEYDMY